MHHRELKTIWDFQRESPAKRLRRAHFFRRRNSAPSLRCLFRSFELDCSQPPLHRIALDNGISIFGRTVVIASGARYRRPEIENLDRFEGSSVSYWATPIEAAMCEGGDIVLVGGGNSAGQAAVYLSAHARQVYLAVRSPGLDASMSRYLIDRINATPNIDLRAQHRRHGTIGRSGWHIDQRRHDVS